MSAQPSLDDYLEGERQKRNGLALAGTGDRLWNESADRAIAHLAAQGHHFTADHVRDLAGPPDHPAAMGAALNRAARAGLIVVVGFETSKRASRHCGLLRIWQGT
jgi:threonine dehydrogenase-like Zn-dependent dehydrogenase